VCIFPSPLKWVLDRPTPSVIYFPCEQPRSHNP
jgi:hypothetical protein